MIYVLIAIFGVLLFLAGATTVAAITGWPYQIFRHNSGDLKALEKRVQRIFFDRNMGAITHDEAVDELMKCFDTYVKKHC